jgi:hypothetical protein
VSCGSNKETFIFLFIFGGQEFVGQSFAYVIHFVLLKNVLIRTQRATVESRRTTSLATHIPLSHQSSYLATHLLFVTVVSAGQER